VVDAVTGLAWHYANPLAAARAAHDAGVPVIGITSPTVPPEIVIAGGGFPVVLRRPAAPTPYADLYLEPGVFAPRIRGLFEGLVSGEWSFLRAVVIPRTSEQEYKLYLYLREIARTGPPHALPPVYLYDLLHARSPEAFDYGRQRTVALVRTLGQVLGRQVSDGDLAAAIARCNEARGAMTRLVALRAGRPRLRGALAIPLLGASSCLDPGEYAPLAGRAADALESGPQIEGPRIVVAGTPVASLALTEALESAGAVVTWEEEHGRMTDRRIDERLQPARAIFEHYYVHVPSPRVFPRQLADAPFEAAVRAGADAIVFWYPPEDYVAGWDYPRRRAWADALGLPHLRIRAEPDAFVSDHLAAFVSSVTGRAP
jgi:benzoyl-CoA reductase/2-hydroxyglutaryl-CoA dehydratase subunit BcrC/BadD/HgdB